MKKILLFCLVQIYTLLIPLAAQDKSSIALIQESPSFEDPRIIAIGEAVEMRCRNLLASMGTFSVAPADFAETRNAARSRGLDNVITYAVSIVGTQITLTIEAWDIQNDFSLIMQSGTTQDYLKMFNLTSDLIHPVAELLYGQKITYGTLEFRTDGLPGWYVELNGESLEPSQSKMELIAGTHQVKVFSADDRQLYSQTVYLGEGEKQTLVIINDGNATLPMAGSEVVYYPAAKYNINFFTGANLVYGTEKYRLKAFRGFRDFTDELGDKFPDDSELQRLISEYDQRTRTNVAMTFGGAAVALTGVGIMIDSINVDTYSGEEMDMNQYFLGLGVSTVGLIIELVGAINRNKPPEDVLNYYHNNYPIRY